jgi:hypothetical protein
MLESNNEKKADHLAPKTMHATYSKLWDSKSSDKSTNQKGSLKICMQDRNACKLEVAQIEWVCMKQPKNRQKWEPGKNLFENGFHYLERPFFGPRSITIQSTIHNPPQQRHQKPSNNSLQEWGSLSQQSIARLVKQEVAVRPPSYMRTQLFVKSGFCYKLHTNIHQTYLQYNKI